MIISDQQQTDQHIEIKYVLPFVCLIVINLGRYVMAIAEKKNKHNNAHCVQHRIYHNCTNNIW